MKRRRFRVWGGRKENRWISTASPVSFLLSELQNKTSLQPLVSLFGIIRQLKTQEKWTGSVLERFYWQKCNRFKSLLSFWVKVFDVCRSVVVIVPCGSAKCLHALFDFCFAFMDSHLKVFMLLLLGCSTTEFACTGASKKIDYHESFIFFLSYFHLGDV